MPAQQDDRLGNSHHSPAKGWETFLVVVETTVAATSTGNQPSFTVFFNYKHLVGCWIFVGQTSLFFSPFLAGQPGSVLMLHSCL